MLFFSLLCGVIGCASVSKQISSTSDSSITSTESKSKNGFRCIKDGQYRYKVRTQNGMEYKIVNAGFCINHALYKIISFDCLSRNCLARHSYQNKNSNALVCASCSSGSSYSDVDDQSTCKTCATCDE